MLSRYILPYSIQLIWFFPCFNKLTVSSNSSGVPIRIHWLTYLNEYDILKRIVIPAFDIRLGPDRDITRLTANVVVII